ncbi:MAG: hypothetical protein IJV45_02220 [Prevotella sp.]|nr:hypothetical protein [Prevotella sp.]
MKKQYINPATSIFDIQMQHQVLAGSGGVTKNSDGDVESVGIGGDYDGTSPIKSRGGSLWDED